MNKEKWHAEIFYRDGRRMDVAHSNDKNYTQHASQQIFDQELKRATNKNFEPTMVVLVKDN